MAALASRPAFLIPAAILAGLSLRGASERPISPGDSVGATNWGGCYGQNYSKCAVEDGADYIAATGSTALKLWMSTDTSPREQFRFGPCNFPEPLFTTPLEAAKHPSFMAVFQNPHWTTIDLVTYAGSNPGNNANYWRDGEFTAADAARETSQMYDLAMHLLTSPDLPSGRTYILEHWEGDWSIRPAYNASLRPTDHAVAHMRAWLTARQAGVSQARARVGSLARSSVWHASEANLVVSSIQTGFPNIVTEVLPFVQLDMVSYSSYDCQERTVAAPPAFTDCLR